MVEAHEHHEKAHEAGHGGNKGVAILITVLAALLAITEMGGKNAQNIYMSTQIEAANLWSFYQAKTIRLTALKTTAEALDAIGHDAFGERKAAVEKQVQRWRQTGERYDSEPETGEGRKELTARAKATEAKRDKALAAYHHFEYGSAGFQLAIVLASASVITGVAALAWVAGGLGAIGLVLNLLGWLAPTLVHF